MHENLGRIRDGQYLEFHLQGLQSAYCRSDALKHQEGKTKGGIVLDEVTRNYSINKSRRY